jgi:predicted NBD/HSP70 family sugar kinase
MISLGIDVGGRSVKVAAVEGSRVLWTGKSENYEKPSTEQLVTAIKQAAGNRGGDAIVAGICIPGLLNADRTAVEYSVNVPGLMGIRLDELVRRGLTDGVILKTTASDAVASAYDLYATHHLRGRLVSLSLGTGVGAAVLDDGEPLHVDGDSPGHFGQLDVSIEGHPVIGPDGGAGGLEGYLGAAALEARYGPNAQDILKNITVDAPPMKALVRAIRIAHAIYRPDHVGLVGGIGIRLGHLVPQLLAAAKMQLTSIARPGWTLTTGDHDHHAAVGAAKMALAG